VRVFAYCLVGRIRFLKFGVADSFDSKRFLSQDFKDKIWQKKIWRIKKRLNRLVG